MRVMISNDEQNFCRMQATVILSHSEKKTIALPTDAVIRDEKEVTCGA